jgi:hypothetical protein
MNIREKFLSLTSRTYPHGTEYELFDILPQNLDMDIHGNLFTKIGDSDVMFTSHLDTATSALTPINHVLDGNVVKTDGKSILGADDKAGVTIMLYMIENKVPGLYYFFLGEEVGCIGSKKLAEQHKIEKIPNINKVISFDRRGTNSVITYQASSRCCSDKFGEALATELNNSEASFKYLTDPTGIYTDSAQFVKIYPECTNISVGYYQEHTFSERQDLEHLEKLAKACLKVDWTSLPVERDPSKVEYRDYYSSCYDWDFDPYDRPAAKRYTGGSSTFKQAPPQTKRILFYDKKYNYVSSVDIATSTGEIKELDISNDRLYFEEESIYDFLNQIELEYTSMMWDGLKLTINYPDGRICHTSRIELEDYVDCLDLKDLIEENVDEVDPVNQYPLKGSYFHDTLAEDWKDFIGI